MKTTPDISERVREAEAALRRRRGLPEKENIRRSRRGVAEGVDVMRNTDGTVTIDGVKLAPADVLNDVIDTREETFREEVHQWVMDLPMMKDKRVIEVRQDQQKIGEVEGLTHHQQETLIRACSVKNQKGFRKNILLKGPTGGGKSTAALLGAKALGLSYDYIGQIDIPQQVVGYVHPVSGEYITTPFVEQFINGGVFVAEEGDAWSPRATLALNIPLANDYITLPDGRKFERHPDCVIIMCTNTWGTGATAEYVGRNKLDNAFLDRFAIKMMWEYDTDLERAAAGDDIVVDAVQLCRFNADKAGIKVTISPRCSIDIADMVRSGFTMKEAMEMNFLSSLDREQRKTVLEDVIF